MRRSCIIAASIAAILVAIGLFIIWSMAGSVMQSASNPAGSASSGANSVTTANSDAREIIFCDILRDQATRSQCDYYRKVWSRLEVGSGGVEYPERMTRGEAAGISFVISRDEQDAPIAELLGSEPNMEVKLKVGRLMAAQIQGDGFAIEPKGLQQRDLFVGNSTRWDWKVTPLKAPKHRLLLSAYVVVSASDGTKKESLLKTLELPLAVEVTWGQRFGDIVDDTQAWLTRGTNWIQALTTFLVAAGALFAVFRRKKPQREG